MERLLVFSSFPSEDADAPCRVIAELPGALLPYAIVNVTDAEVMSRDDAIEAGYAEAVLAWELGDDAQVTTDAEIDAFAAALEDADDLVGVLS